MTAGNNPSVLQNREFSFTINHQNQEIYIRYLSFASKAEFKQEILKKCPEKIDIGAVYSGKPKMKNSLKLFKPVQRELVFDIDMTDYDDIRACCSGANICIKCWKFMTIALRLLDYALRDCFGFKHILYVYSGRRGIHCWICDERARFLTEDARKAIVGFLEVIKGGEQKAKKVFLPANMHPFLQSAETVLKDYFETVVLEDQDILSDKEKMEKMLDILPAALREETERVWSKINGSKLKWLALKEIIARDPKKSPVLLSEIMFQYLYPRLDAQVSMHLNHLLKSPFCIHPKTGRVCVPIDIKECESFDPLSVPTVASLIQEINVYDANNMDEDGEDMEMAAGDEDKKMSDWKKTSMVKYIEIFDQFKHGLEEDRRKEMLSKRMEEDNKLNF